jgi:hypothetical protein
MLAGMKLATLALGAHAATPAPPPFNGLFYATVGTIIPVLYLALAVQGTTCADLLKTAARAFGTSLQRLHGPGPAAGIYRPYIGSVFAASTALLIPALGVLGETQALIALDLQRVELRSMPQ